MKPQTKLFIGGEFVDALEGGTVATLNPHDNSPIADIAEARSADVDRAVEAARKALSAWSAMSAMDRGRLLLKLADAIEADAENLARLESLDTGHPLRDTRGLDVPRTAVTFRYFGGMADKFEGTVVPVEAGFLNYVLREPVGVVGQIVPWNFPLMFTSWKMGPALAAGCTVVLKPSELTPLSTLRIAELMRDVGFPAGVVNIVPGYGATAGQRLVDHPDVRKIAFTGSTAIGRGVVRGSAGNLKKVQLELGGKGANIVFDDANLSLRSTAPPSPSSTTRARLASPVRGCCCTRRSPTNSSTASSRSPARSGSAIRSSEHRDGTADLAQHSNASSTMRVAREEGGEILTGGRAPDDPALAKGCYVEPTVVRAEPHAASAGKRSSGRSSPCRPSRTRRRRSRSPIAMEYGLGGGLWTGNLQRAHRFAKAMISGMVWVNCYKRVNPGSPFGGVHASGYGREMGFEAMREYTSPKSVWVNVDAQLPPYYRR